MERESYFDLGKKLRSIRSKVSQPATSLVTCAVLALVAACDVMDPAMTGEVEAFGPSSAEPMISVVMDEVTAKNSEAAVDDTKRASVAAASGSGLGTLVYSTRSTVKAGAWQMFNLSRDQLATGNSYVAIVTPVRGNPDLVGSTFNGSQYVTLRQSRFVGTRKDETHLFLSDIPVGSSASFGVYGGGTTASEYTLAIYRRTDIPLAFPFSGYTAYTAPVSAVMDNAIGEQDVIRTYDGGTAKRADGCLKYTAGYRACVPGEKATASNGIVMGFLIKGSWLGAINYTDPNSGYVFYDEHTGYDYALGDGTPIYADLGGTVTVTNNAYNEVQIDHGNGWVTHYLHMQAASLAVSNGQKIGTGYLIGKVGSVGAGGPHLHYTVKSNSVRIDPYGRKIWR